MIQMQTSKFNQNQWRVPDLNIAWNNRIANSKRVWLAPFKPFFLAVQTILSLKGVLKYAIDINFM